MNEEFLTGLGLDGETCGKILEEYNAEKLGEKVRCRLAEEGAVDCAAAAALLDSNGMTEDNFAERIADLKEKHSALFGKTEMPRFVSQACAQTVTADGFAGLGYSDRLAMFKSNPALYKKLVTK